MRILIADPLRAVVGGAQTYEKALIASLRERGHDVALVHEVPMGTAVDATDGTDPRHARFCLEELGLRAVCDGVEAWRPDVLYSQGLWSGDLEASLLRSYPAALYAHAYYGTCVTGTKHHTRPASAVCERTFGPACLVLNYARGCGARHPGRVLRAYREQSVRLEHIPLYRRVLVASRHMLREYERHGVPASRLELLPHFASIAADLQLTAPGPPSGQVLFASRITRLKGGAVLVDALGLAAKALGRALTLVVVGDGPERQALEGRARDLGITVRFLGWQNAEGVAEAMRGAELLAVPSLWPEPFGLVGIEAGGLGVPAVGFAVGGIPDWLRGGESGEIAPADPPSAAGLADAIVRALGDRGHYERLREGAWRIARSHSRDAHVTRLEEILTQVAGMASRSPSTLHAP